MGTKDVNFSPVYNASSIIYGVSGGQNCSLNIIEVALYERLEKFQYYMSPSTYLSFISVNL